MSHTLHSVLGGIDCSLGIERIKYGFYKQSIDTTFDKCFYLLLISLNQFIIGNGTQSRFFSELSEGEMLVVLGMAGEYYRAASGFLKGRWAMGSALTSGLGANKKVNPVQALIKWVLSGEIETTLRVKLMAFKRFMAEVESVGGRDYAVSRPAFRLFENNKMMEMYDREQKEFQQKEISQTEFAEWLNNSQGLFESFELDCTLHNLDATMFWMELILNPEYMKMVYGLIDFQDDDVKEKVLKEIGDTMSAFR